MSRDNMTDLSDVISGLARGPSTAIQPFGKCPVTHKQVNVSGAGFLDDRYRMTNSGMATRSVTSPSTSGSFEEQIVRLNTALSPAIDPVPPSFFDPRRSFIVCDTSATGTKQWTFPTAEEVVRHAKSFFGTQNIVPGFSWTVTIITNNPAGSGFTPALDLLALDFATAGPSTSVFGNNGGAFLGIHVLDVFSSCEMTVVLDNIQTGNAAVTYYIH